MFDTHILDRAIKRKQTDQEQARIVMLDNVSNVLKDIRRTMGIKEAIVFGSLLVHHQWYCDSDVDVAVSGCSLYILDVMKAIEDVTLCDVDILDLDTHPSASSIRRQGMKIYG